jgi:hypothetical protein
MLAQLAQISLGEFSDIVTSAALFHRRATVPTKLRLQLRDGSFVDVWYSPDSIRYSLHWEQRVQRGLFYRHDNAPDHPAISTHPKHFHDGDEHTVVESRISSIPAEALREFLTFVRQKLNEWNG